MTKPFPSIWHQNALKGIRGPIHDGEAQTGYYRDRNGNRFVFWEDSHDGTLRCQRNGAEYDMQRALEQWPYLSKLPVDEEAFYAHEETGKWPDEHKKDETKIDPSVSLIDSLAEQIEGATAAIENYKDIDSDEMSGAAQTLRALLNDLGNKADKAREAEKAPFLEGGRAVDAKWKPLVDQAKGASLKVRKSMEAWENHKRAQLKAAQIAAEAAAETTPGGTIAVQSNAPAPSHQIRGATGKAANVGIVKEAEITNWLPVFMHFIDNKEVHEVLQKLANAAVNAGIAINGVKVIDKTRIR